MESSTKTKLSDEQIVELVKVNFGENVEVASIKVLDGGMMNAAWILTLENPLIEEKEILLKVSFTPDKKTLTYEQGIMWAEIEFYKHLEGKDIPVPRLLAYDLSRKHIGCHYFFMSKLEGKLWRELEEEEKITPENREALKKELGKYNAVIHSAKGDYFGYIREAQKWQFQTWSDAFSFMIQNMIQDGINENIDLFYDEILEKVEKYREVLDEVKEPVLINYDMWDGNILLVEEQNSYIISGIIDFERSYYGDPYADFIASINIYDDVETEESFQQGYSQFTGIPFTVTENDRKRMDLYRIYMALNLGIETYRFDEEYAQEAIADSKEQIRKCLDCL